MMDVINPETYWIDGRCYRRNPSKTGCVISTQKYWSSRDPSSYDTPTPTPQSAFPLPYKAATATFNKPYVEEDDYVGCDPDAPDDTEDEGYIIEPTQNNGFRTKCDNIPSQLFAVVIGAKGATKSRIEKDTRTKIVVPRQGIQGFIEIEGRTIKDVTNARRRIDLLTSQTRGKSDATHFPCFPLNSANIVQRVKEFKDATTSRGADPGLFIDAEKVHLTICVVTLFDEKEREKAVLILQNSLKEIAEQLSHNGPITVHIKDLEIMNDDASQVDVLYAKCYEVGTDNVLQTMADYIAKKLGDSGLAKQNRGEHVKLHCTIMNSLKKAERVEQDQNQPGNNNEGGGGGRNNGRRRQSRPKFDASFILKDFKEYDFGVVDIAEIKLATRYTSGADGFYKFYYSIPL